MLGAPAFSPCCEPFGPFSQKYILYCTPMFNTDASIHIRNVIDPYTKKKVVDLLAVGRCHRTNAFVSNVVLCVTR